MREDWRFDCHELENVEPVGPIFLWGYNLATSLELVPPQLTFERFWLRAVIIRKRFRLATEVVMVEMWCDLRPFHFVCCG